MKEACGTQDNTHLGRAGPKTKVGQRESPAGQLPVRMAQAAMLDGRGESSGLTSGSATIKSLTQPSALSASSPPTRVEARRGACSRQHEATFPPEEGRPLLQTPRALGLLSQGPQTVAQKGRHSSRRKGGLASVHLSPPGWGPQASPKPY